MADTGGKNPKDANSGATRSHAEDGGNAKQVPNMSVPTDRSTKKETEEKQNKNGKLSPCASTSATKQSGSNAFVNAQRAKYERHKREGCKTEGTTEEDHEEQMRDGDNISIQSFNMTSMTQIPGDNNTELKPNTELCSTLGTGDEIVHGVNNAAKLPETHNAEGEKEIKHFVKFEEHKTIQQFSETPVFSIQKVGDCYLLYKQNYPPVILPELEGASNVSVSKDMIFIHNVPKYLIKIENEMVTVSELGVAKFEVKRSESNNTKRSGQDLSAEIQEQKGDEEGLEMKKVRGTTQDMQNVLNPPQENDTNPLDHQDTVTDVNTGGSSSDDVKKEEAKADVDDELICKLQRMELKDAPGQQQQSLEEAVCKDEKPPIPAPRSKNKGNLLAFKQELNVEKNLIEGLNLNLRCSVNKLHMKPTWYIDGKPLEQNERITQTSKGFSHFLEIQNVCQQDSGEYTVSIENLSSTSKVTIKELLQKDDTVQLYSSSDSSESIVETIPCEDLDEQIREWENSSTSSMTSITHIADDKEKNIKLDTVSEGIGVCPLQGTDCVSGRKVDNAAKIPQTQIARGKEENKVPETLDFSIEKVGNRFILKCNNLVVKVPQLEGASGVSVYKDFILIDNEPIYNIKIENGKVKISKIGDAECEVNRIDNNSTNNSGNNESGLYVESQQPQNVEEELDIKKVRGTTQDMQNVLNQPQENGTNPWNHHDTVADVKHTGSFDADVLKEGGKTAFDITREQQQSLEEAVSKDEKPPKPAARSTIKNAEKLENSQTQSSYSRDMMERRY
ncbi:uncharacterized protein LOC132738787 isoform X2 [Ruditapes philippinarum]|uniref:uncharacterized protein LOC132738787 isoform X2 n=1 Tax=Ruditapes philippinarum TaxID=129788 RepID=UPI00295B3347|nr:uncharacterized protein LOC132738787 isoform X2 [Ruditapes philippinarum]